MNTQAMPKGMIFETMDLEFNPNLTNNNSFVGEWEKLISKNVKNIWVCKSTNWLKGTDVPNDNLGSNGDFYLNQSTGNYYKKTNGTWSNVGNLDTDNIQIEAYSNGIRIKKDNNYIHSICWGIVEMTTTGSNGTALTTVNFPFTFNSAGGVQTSIISGNPLIQNGGNNTLSNNSVNITVQRTTAGTSGVRWYAYGR